MGKTILIIKPAVTKSFTVIGVTIGVMAIQYGTILFIDVLNG